MKVFQDIKNTMTAETELTIPNTKHPFFITVDASLVGLGAVLIQMNEENKMSVFLTNHESFIHKNKNFQY